MKTIRASRLTTFSVAADGASVSIGVADDAGAPCALELPASCLQALLMTLPEMASQSLRRKHRNPKTRLVFSVASWTIESSTDAHRLILTLGTPDGFRASFALSAEELAQIASTALTGEEAADASSAATKRLSH